jgi:hypothetical protein
MITAPTPCFYMLKVEGEVAQQFVAELSPSSAKDIISAVLVSSDFDIDIAAVNSFDASITSMRALSPSADIVEEYNPLYVPSGLDVLDQHMQSEQRGDAIRFVGMNGNPFILKTVEITQGDEPLISGKIEYRPFELPSYSDIVASIESTQLN